MTVASLRPDPSRGLVELRLERVRLHVLRALARARGDGATLDGELADVDRALAAAPRGRDTRLAERVGLGPDELDFLWLVAAVSGDPMVAPHAVALAGAEARRGATLALYAAIADLPAHRVRALAATLGPAHPLRRFGLIEPADDHTVDAMTPFRAARRLIAFLDGDDEVDQALSASGGAIAIPAGLSHDAGGDAARKRLTATIASGDDLLVVVSGRERSGRRTLAACAALDAGRAAVALDVERLPPTLAALETGLVALRREHALSRALPVIAGLGDLTPERDGLTRRRAIESFIADIAGPVIVVAGAGDVELQSGRPTVVVELPVPEATSRRSLWRDAVGDDASEADRFAIRYRMSAGEIARVITAARAASDGDAPSLRELTEGVRAAIGQRLRGLAERVDIRHDWDDLVVPDDVRDQLGDLVGRVRNAYQVLERWRFRNVVARGGGVAALFAGEPGTGKTMAAGLVARALDLDLYQVDLSAVVSKWVGETEKNLTRVFEAAEAGHALLLFDEADALFAKRTEVKGSNDRYANLEVNHLLQRIEAFGGVAILTTNMDASLDPALRRRLAAKIDFWPPDEHERARLWRRILEGRAPLARDVDAARLAQRFTALTGGTIRNAAVAAAFRAAAIGGQVTQALLERAAIDQYRAIGRMWNEESKR